MHDTANRRSGCKFSQFNSPPRLYPYLRFAVSLAVAAQDSGPSGSLLLSCKNFAFSASCRLSVSVWGTASSTGGGLAMPRSPGRRGQFGDALNRSISQAGQHVAEMIVDWGS